MSSTECPGVEEEEDEEILWSTLLAGDEVKQELMLGPDLNEAEYLELDLAALPGSWIVYYIFWSSPSRI